MRNRNRWIAGGVFLLAVGTTLTMYSQAQSQRPTVITPKPKTQNTATLKGQIAAATKVEESDVDLVLKQLGPAISERLARGEKVELPGLGLFRVIRVPEHKDLVDGRPTTIAASNYVEFLPVSELIRAANAPGAVPAEVVPPFHYNQLPNQTPGQKVPNSRAPNTRTP